MASYQYDVFLSYAPAQEPWVKSWLLPRLEGAKVRVYERPAPDAAEVGPALLTTAIAASRHSLLIVSPAWTERVWGDVEAALSQPADSDTLRASLLPLLLEPCALPGQLAGLPGLDLTDPAQRDLQLARLLRTLLGDYPLDEDPAGAPPAAAPPAPAAPASPDASRDTITIDEVGSITNSLVTMGAGAVGVANSSGVAIGVGAVSVVTVINEAQRSSRITNPWRPALAPRPDCPYPGMQPFRPEDARFFYGRDKEIRAMIQHLRSQRLLFVLGPSGSGKSSLVRAGLLPRLAQSSQWPQGYWLVRQLRPGASPCAALAEQLELAPGAEHDVLPADLGGAVTRLLAAHGPARRLLLFVDQGEELFTTAEPAEQARFSVALMQLCALESVALVMALRADFYGDLMASDLWPIPPEQRLDIAPLRGEALREAIRYPAEDVGVEVEDGLLERLLADGANEPGVLPLLQEALVQLWDGLREPPLTLHAYEELGGEGQTGLAAAMATRADMVIEALTPEQQAAARRIFMRLIQFCEGRPNTRRQQRVRDLDVQGDDQRTFEQTLDQLVKARLLTVSGEEGQDDKRVDIAHEALIGGWPRLRQWMREWQGGEHVRRRLEDKAAEWDARGRGSAGLLDEIEWHEAEEWLRGPNAAEAGYSEILPLYVEKSGSQVKEDLRVRSEARYARRARIVNYTMGALVTILVITALFAYKLSLQVTESLRLADALNLAETEPETSLRLILRSLEQSPSLEAENALRKVLFSEAAYHKSKVFSGHAAGVRGFDWSPDGTRLASASEDRSVIIWDTGDVTATTRLVGHSDWVRGVDWSPDGRRVASAAYDGTVRVWELPAFAPPVIEQSRVIGRHDNAAYQVKWSPDGRRLASVSKDGSLRLWDVASGSLLAGVDENVGETNELDWSPDGTRLAYAADDGTVRLWLLEDLLKNRPGAPPIGRSLVLERHQGFVMDVDWSPDGTRLVSAGADSKIMIWDAASGERINVLEGHTGRVNGVEWSGDGKRLSSASSDSTVRVWDAASGTSLDILVGHGSTVTAAKWSFDGRGLISSSLDRTLRLWDLSTLGATVLRGHRGETLDVDWSADGARLASSGTDTRVRLWDVKNAFAETVVVTASSQIHDVDWSADGARLAFIDDHGQVGTWHAGATLMDSTIYTQTHRYQVAWSPDGTQLAASGRDGEIRLLDAATLRPITSLPNPGRAMALAWSPDGRTLAVGDDVGGVALWDLARGSHVVVGQGHSDRVWSLDWNRDGSRLVSSSQDGLALIWDPASPQQPVASFNKTGKPINGAAWGPDGSSIAVATDDRAAYIWTPGAVEGVPIFAGPRKLLWNVDWSPDGSQLVASVADGTIWVFPASSEDLRARALEFGITPMTDRELTARVLSSR